MKEEVSPKVLEEINGADDEPNKRHQEKDAAVVGARFAERRFANDIARLPVKGLQSHEPMNDESVHPNQFKIKTRNIDFFRTKIVRNLEAHVER